MLTSSSSSSFVHCYYTSNFSCHVHSPYHTHIDPRVIRITFNIHSNPLGDILTNFRYVCVTLPILFSWILYLSTHKCLRVIEQKIRDLTILHYITQVVYDHSSFLRVHEIGKDLRLDFE